MLNIHLDLGDTPSVLMRLNNPAIAQHIANVAAESYADDTLDYIQAEQPFTAGTGQLEQSIGWRGLGNGSSEIYANADYARYVEEGTQPHVILPKDGRKALKIPTAGGGFFFARKVNHPGTDPHPFFFADRDIRERHMQEKTLLVLARYAGGEI